MIAVCFWHLLRSTIEAFLHFLPHFLDSWVKNQDYMRLGTSRIFVEAELLETLCAVSANNQDVGNHSQKIKL
jgi:hypothetical protein